MCKKEEFFEICNKNSWNLNEISSKTIGSEFNILKVQSNVWGWREFMKLYFEDRMNYWDDIFGARLNFWG